MLVVRWAVMVLLLAAAVCFGLFAATGNPRYKKLGIVIFKWTAVAALGFFLVMGIEAVFNRPSPAAQ
jgi:hypothetical protein